MIYGVVKNGVVINVIEAEPNTPFQILFPDAEAVWPVTETSNYAIIGRQAMQGVFQPWTSWTWDAKQKAWQPPTPKPAGAGIYAWLEYSQEWSLVEPIIEPES